TARVSTTACSSRTRRAQRWHTHGRAPESVKHRATHARESLPPPGNGGDFHIAMYIEYSSAVPSLTAATTNNRARLQTRCPARGEITGDHDDDGCHQGRSVVMVHVTVNHKGIGGEKTADADRHLADQQREACAKDPTQYRSCKQDNESLPQKDTRDITPRVTH